MKRGRPRTAPAMLAGLCILLSMSGLLEHVSLDRQREVTAKILWLHPR
jgi:hypothetical protein